jgi:hypothetical protein
MGVIRFDGINDQLKFETFTATLANVSDGAWTMAVLCNFTDLTHFNAIAYMLSGAGAGDAMAGLSHSSSSNDLFIDVGTGVNISGMSPSTSTVYMFVLSKGAGTVTPRLAWKAGSGGSWTHVDADGTLANASASDQIQIGTWENVDFFEGHIGLVAFWEGAMSDGNKEALDNNWATSDWWNSAHGQPAFLVELNVDAASTFDLAENAFDVTASGTVLDDLEDLDAWNFDGTGEGEPEPPPAGEAGPTLIRLIGNRQVW